MPPTSRFWRHQVTFWNSMPEPEAPTAAFVIRIWIEETAGEAGQARWRGQITHVGDDRKRYFERLDAVAGFVAPYLEQMGVRPGWWWRAGRWLRRLG